MLQKKAGGATLGFFFSLLQLGDGFGEGVFFSFSQESWLLLIMLPLMFHCNLILRKCSSIKHFSHSNETMYLSLPKITFDIYPPHSCSWKVKLGIFPVARLPICHHWSLSGAIWLRCLRYSKACSCCVWCIYYLCQVLESCLYWFLEGFFTPYLAVVC